MLLSATYAVSRRRSFSIFALSLSIFSIGLTFWLAASPNHWLIIISHGSLVILIVFFAAAMSLLCFGQRKGDLGQNLRRGLRLSSFGLCLDFRLSLIEELQPGSFGSATTPMPHDLVARVMQLRYFSFVTLATVGYGDIVPRTPMARTLALLEAMVGQFYLVALVGRLVGLHIVHGKDPRAD